MIIRMKRFWTFFFMIHTYSSQVTGNKDYQELMICILNSNGNPVDSFTHNITKKQALDFSNSTIGAHHFGVKGWTLDPADNHQGYAEKFLENLG